ncbi:hypothetical protein O9G_004318 [Rozella allomycis CSF55]|uniref:MACPF domain-containing protein n=1 Tax=Rozella allomycis (strain CSF55) TaxID=988480 RepID=A0A075AZT1_ROZAC|nr:hypothetical protein O9G_004318 [Rozella allomycis CSF55]|eukprot:EPZ34202.1 hypothetical protein O9G_004318 [Rozella allomycis CSF55]
MIFFLVVFLWGNAVLCADTISNTNTGIEIKHRLKTLDLKVVPGADFVGMGYDASNNYGTYDNIRQPLFKKRIEGSEDYIFNQNYLVPSNVDAYGLWRTKAESRSFKSETEFKKSLSERVSGEGGGGCFGVSVEVSASHESSSSKESQKSIVYNVFEAHSELFELHMHPHGFLDAEKGYRDALQALYEKSTKCKSKTATDCIAELYGDFYSLFTDYGTHYVKQAVMGGSVFVEVSTFIDSEAEREEVSQAFSVQVSSWFGSGGVSASRSDSKASKKFTQQSVAKVTHFGGDPLSALMVNMDEDLTRSFNHWLKTVKFKPNISGFKIVPLFQLLPVESDWDNMRTQKDPSGTPVQLSPEIDTKSAKESKKMNWDNMRTLMKLAHEFYLQKIPPGTQIHELIPRYPPSWSSSFTIPEIGSGQVTFSAMVSESITVHFASVPQSPLLIIKFGLESSTFKLFLDESEHGKILNGDLNLNLPKDIYSDFKINIYNGEELTITVGENTVFKRLTDYKDILNKIKYFAFQGNSYVSTSIVNVKTSQGMPRRGQIAIETCEDKGKKSIKPWDETLMWWGIEVSVTCVPQDDGSVYEYLKLDKKSNFGSRIEGSSKTEQSNSWKLRIYPKEMIIDLCDPGNESSIPPGVIVSHNYGYDKGTQLSAQIELPDFLVFDDKWNGFIQRGDSIYGSHGEIEKGSKVKVIENVDSKNGKHLESWYGSAYLSYHYDFLAQCTKFHEYSSSKKAVKVLLKELKEQSAIVNVKFGEKDFSYSRCPGGSFNVQVDSSMYHVASGEVSQITKYGKSYVTDLDRTSLTYLVDIPYTSLYELSFVMEGSALIEAKIDDVTLTNAIYNNDRYVQKLQEIIPCGVHKLKLSFSNTEGYLFEEFIRGKLTSNPLNTETSVKLFIVIIFENDLIII